MQVITGTFIGQNSATVEIPCSFDPDGIVIESDLDSVTQWGVGVAHEVFIRGMFNCMFRHNADSGTGYVTASIGTSDLDTPFGWDSTSSGAPIAKWENGKLTVSNVNTSATRSQFRSDTTYTYVIYKK